MRIRNEISIKRYHAIQRNLACFTAFFIASGTIMAQQVPRFSQYIMNEFLINPSVAGVDGMTVANLTGRMEWAGFSNGTPKTCSFTIQSRLLKRGNDVKTGNKGNKLVRARNGRIGLGAGLISDYNGAFERTGISGTYAYHIILHNAQLSFGLTGSLTQLKILDQKVEFKDEGDRLIGLTGTNIWIPDFAAGITYMTPHFHSDFSAVQLTESNLAFGNTPIQLRSTGVNYSRNYYLILSYHNNFRANQRWEYEASVLIKSNDRFKEGIKAQGDILGRLIYNKSFWFGAGYRTSNDFIALLGLKVNRLYLTYSFDYGTNSLSENSFGSHELSVSLKYGDKARRFLWLERY